MKKNYIILGVGTLIAVISFIIYQPSKLGESAEISSYQAKQQPLPPEINPQEPVEEKSNQPKTVRSEDGRLIVKGVLPPELKELKDTFDSYSREIERAVNEDDPILADARDPEKVIADMDALIEKTNERLGVNTAELVAALHADIPLHENLKEVKQQREAVEEKVVELERMFD